VNRKADFFKENESIRIDSHNESNRVDSNRELECSSVQAAQAQSDYCRLRMTTDRVAAAGVYA